jgi:hypothetical protein
MIARVESHSPALAGLPLSWKSAQRRAVFCHPLFEALVESRPIARLREISFLGAIDYLLAQGPIKQYQTRYAHTLGVAYLAICYAGVGLLRENQRNELVSAAFLHDVGHGPLSHTLEPFFLERYEINHHVVADNILSGKGVFGREICNILQQHNVNPERVAMLMKGKLYSESYNAAFSHPINIDTVEAITRADHIANKKFRARPLHELVSAHFKHKWSKLDDFWRLKSDVYTRIIDDGVGHFVDSELLRFVSEQNCLAPEDFFLTEPQFFKKYPQIWRELKALSSNASPDCLRSDDYEPRKFWINADASEGSPERYARSR